MTTIRCTVAASSCVKSQGENNESEITDFSCAPFVSFMTVSSWIFRLPLNDTWSWIFPVHVPLLHLRHLLQQVLLVVIGGFLRRLVIMNFVAAKLCSRIFYCQHICRLPRAVRGDTGGGGSEEPAVLLPSWRQPSRHDLLIKSANCESVALSLFLGSHRAMVWW